MGVYQIGSSLLLQLKASYFPQPMSRGCKGWGIHEMSLLLDG